MNEARVSMILNPRSVIDNFEQSLKSKIHVDKTGLIAYLNKITGTTDKYICVSRPRRFGKTWAANMLTAYYSKNRDTGSLFKGMLISGDPSFEVQLNKYNVIFLNIQNFLSSTATVPKLVSKIKSGIMKELRIAYPKEKLSRDLVKSLAMINQSTSTGFIFIIDEWDSIFRIRKNDVEGQKAYLDFLRWLLKDQSYVHLAYMTGILPIKKYGTHSALNMFYEFSMANPSALAEYVGFTEAEVKALCARENMSFEQASQWYDGYLFNDLHVYNPLSVVRALNMRSFSNYWNQTETFEALKMPIALNFAGLKDSILNLMAMSPVKISTSKFQNDMLSFSSVDDVLTLLVHLGYLAYNSVTFEVSIPNSEIMEEFKNSVEALTWAGISDLLQESRYLLECTWSLNASKIAEAIQKAHNESSSILKYNDENSLCCVVTLAYYAANDYYIIFREMASGKGYIDLLFLPKPSHIGKPAIVVELKWDKTAKGALSQVKEKNYPEKIMQYTGNIILVGINYDKTSKTNFCEIEQFNKL
ncbi:MAG: ATP-binding protein [Clostridiales bacterium]|jgi:hypothetical protein|nr:ATP-binding protein [Clostridiales bacterium]